MTACKQVLVVDDDPVFCRLVERGLQQHGYQVVVANNEAQALDASQQTVFNHVLLDLRLGDDSGMQLIKPLLALMPECCIIVMTGYASLATAVQAVKMGAANYLAKPVDIPLLLKTMADTDSEKPSSDIDQDDAPPTSLKRLEWEHIQRVLQENDGNISATARQLNMHRRTLQRKLQKKPSD